MAVSRRGTTTRTLRMGALWEIAQKWSTEMQGITLSDALRRLLAAAVASGRPLGELLAMWVDTSTTCSCSHQAAGHTPDPDGYVVSPCNHCDCKDFDPLATGAALIRYRGVRRDGKAACGASETATVEELARDLFEQGWRQAVLTATDGTEVGGIAKEGARRIWWAES